jgi:hypothetical protein
MSRRVHSSEIEREGSKAFLAGRWFTAPFWDRVVSMALLQWVKLRLPTGAGHYDYQDLKIDQRLHPVGARSLRRRGLDEAMVRKVLRRGPPTKPPYLRIVAGDAVRKVRLF